MGDRLGQVAANGVITGPLNIAAMHQKPEYSTRKKVESGIVLFDIIAKPPVPHILAGGMKIF